MSSASSELRPRLRQGTRWQPDPQDPRLGELAREFLLLGEIRPRQSLCGQEGLAGNGNRGPGRGLSLVRSWPLRTGRTWTRPRPLDRLARVPLPQFRMGKLRSREDPATQKPSELIFILTGSSSGPHSWDRRGGCGCRLPAARFGPGSRWARLLTAWPLLQQTGWASSARPSARRRPPPTGWRGNGHLARTALRTAPPTHWADGGRTHPTRSGGGTEEQSREDAVQGAEHAPHRSQLPFPCPASSARPKSSCHVLPQQVPRRPACPSGRASEQPA